jgi:crotonobetaine/carnitine-CoA ligase
LQAELNPDAPFVFSAGNTLTYADMDDLANRTAKGLGSVGVSRGDRVCIALPNGIEFLAAWFGVSRLGAIEVPINPEFKAAQIKYVIEDAGANLLVTNRAFFEENQAVIQHCSCLSAIVFVDDFPDVSCDKSVSTHQFSELLKNDFDLGSLQVVNPSDPVAIIYTSGTTGMPKGVLLCHEQELTLGGNIARSLQLIEQDCFYNFFPLHHNTGQGIITCAVLLTGARMLLIDRFSRTRFWEDVKRFGCTTFFGMGAILEILNKDPDGLANSAGHTLRIGWGIAMGVEQVKRFTERFGVPFVTGYGATEVNMVAISLPGEMRPGLVGPIEKDFEVAIVDEFDVPAAMGNVGQIVVRPRRPDVTFLGYWGKPLETVEAWKNLWIHTGDAGYFDADRNLYFVDRIKDVIRHRGNNVSSLEVENVLLELQSVSEVAVFPVKSELGGYEQDVMAMIVLSGGAIFDPTAIIAHCVDRLPYYAIPRYIDTAFELPKTATSKVKKIVLRESGILLTTWDRDAAGVKVKSIKSHQR